MASSVQFKLLNQPMGKGWLHQKLPLGTRTILQADWGQGWKELHQGIVFDWDYTNDSVGSLTVKAYDMLIYLLRSKDDRYYPKGTRANAIINDIAKAWKIPVAQMSLPAISLSKQIFRGDTVAAMIQQVLDQVRDRGGGKFFMRAYGGKIYVLPQAQNKEVYHFGSNIVSRMSDNQNIEDLVTRVKIIGKENAAGRAPIVATVDGRKEFGVLQDVIYREQYDSVAAAKRAAQEVLKERGSPRRRRSISAPDVPFLRRGDKVYVAAGTIKGYFAIESITHSADNREMTMEVSEI
ncbi:hypothetical protein [Paenibacillus sp. NPDC057967]|uniref:XkdQ/YqbQ family protein n=1 Tax=Paenibacillus sp. NPDC057967 TaxID=3346293 RepID=UPI0036DA1BF7